MTELNYDDFKRRVNIQDLLVYAGYVLNRRDGLRYPSYVRMDKNGQRARGDKFIVTGNGLCCFQPPEQRNYNVISFIKEHPNLFAEYSAGMNLDRLVNLVCNRLLNNPIIDRPSIIAEKERSQKVFNLNEYKRLYFNINDFETQKAFYPYFKGRGISLDTQRFFANNFFIAVKELKNGKKFSNLSFPLRKPNDLSNIVGLEERSRANKDGKMIYKGMAPGSNASEGLWIACPSGKELCKAKNILWFESALDAMAYYQLNKSELNKNPESNAKEIKQLDNSVFVSTGGNPSVHQFRGMLMQTPDANHHLCFDRDMAGRMFAFNFLIAKDNANYRISQPQKGVMQIDDGHNQYYTDITRNDFTLEETIRKLNLNMLMKPNDLTDYLKTLTDENDIMSGDMDLLKGDMAEKYNKYYAMVEEYSSLAGPIPQLWKDDLRDMRKTIKEEYNTLTKAFTDAYHDYQSAPKVIYEPCSQDYKDWNDQLLDKKQYTSENIIESALDGIEGEYSEQKDDHEENREHDNRESEEIEQRHHFRR